MSLWSVTKDCSVMVVCSIVYEMGRRGDAKVSKSKRKEKSAPLNETMREYINGIGRR